jgi:hypothetical protein
MRYRIMSSRDGTDPPPPRRLRVPVALAVAFVGTSAAVSMWYGGCHSQTDPPPDAGEIEMRGDADVIDVVDADDDTPPTDGSIDAPRDAAPDTPIV